MSRKIDTKTLAGIFQMISNTSERVKFHWGTPPDDVVNFLIRAVVAPPAHGALDCKALLDWVKRLPDSKKTAVDPDKITKLNSQQFRFSTTIDTSTSNLTTSDVENPRILLARKTPAKGKENNPEFSSLTMLQALDATDDKNYRVCPVSYLLMTMPFLNPAVGRSADIETFLNFMPSYVLSRMVPYVDIEFQFARSLGKEDATNYLRSPGLLKFLKGGMQFNTPASSPDDVMAHGHRILRDKDTEEAMDKLGQMKTYRIERSYAGMELFTSPQTLVNPDLLDSTLRYKEILDPYRPFMSLTSLNITVAPTVGYFSNKTGTMVIKLHDRSRLTEIGDLLQPEIYTRTTLWITYGWMHPNEPDNPYASFVNNNMLTRELYGIKNAGYVFENDGQVTITLQLYTLGATELMDVKITAGPDPQGMPSVEQLQRDMYQMVRKIADLANKMGMMGEQGGGTADIRAYPIVNSAAQGEFPNLNDTDVTKAIEKLNSGLQKGKVAKDDVEVLVKTLKALYATTNGKDKKYQYDVRRQQSADAVVSSKFKLLKDNETDPWLPWILPATADKNSPYSKNTFDQKTLVQYAPVEIKPGKGVSKDAKPTSGVCSFAKLISVFVAPQVAESQIADEFQVFFYAFNESSGAASGQSIANFPVDVGMFIEQFSTYVQKMGSSRMSIQEFMRFVIDAQLHDPRSLGYGTRPYYKPFVKGEVATLDEKKKDEFGDWMTQNQSQYGPFHIPSIESYIECVPLVNDPEAIVDLMSDMVHDRSAKEAFYNQAETARRYMKGKYAIRLHIYDKQLNPYKAVESAIKPPTSAPGHFILVSQNEDAVAAQKNAKAQGVKLEVTLQKLFSGIQLEDKEALIAQNIFVPMDLGTNKQVKDYIASVVPTILYGANGSTVISAQLSTNQDALLSSVQMMKQSGRANVQTPAGAGPAGLPITVIPGQLQMTTLGCPMAQLTQKYFVDFNTGTTADNIYCVNKLTHAFTPGKYETQWGFVWADAYGRIAGAGDMTNYLTFLAQQIAIEERTANQKGQNSNKTNGNKKK